MRERVDEVLVKAAHDKAAVILAEMAGERGGILHSGGVGTAGQEKIRKALHEDLGEQLASDIGFHMTDWQSDAGFVVALHLFPERFTIEEVRAGIVNFLIHAPNHIAAAAKLTGYPITDVFEVGALDGEEA